MSEADERLPAGPRGKQGEQGERGERGLSRRVRWALVILFAIGAAGGVTNLYWTAHSDRVAYERQQAEQADQRAQSAAFERKLCITLGRLAALSPPPGTPSGNPSRAYLQAQHDVLAELGPDVGCGRR
jgi:hypothetical protein